jgi:hypothetical protein
VAAAGSFVFGPQGWRKELTVSGAREAAAAPAPYRGGGGVLRILVETTVEGAPESWGA